MRKAAVHALHGMYETVVLWCCVCVLLQATTAAAREANREAVRDRLYGTRRIKYGDEEKEAVHA